ncbi:MAG TPA: hypothetical protein V6D22_13660 [Candidatus Obscuribacterales bacterium]
MASPLTWVDLSNLALLSCYQKPITNIEDTDDPAAVAANLLYDQVRQEEIRDGTWNFARARTTIPLLPNVTPLTDYIGAYQLPVDCLKLHHIGTEYDLWSPHYHDVVAQKIVYFGQAGDSWNLMNGDESPDLNDFPPNSLFIEYTSDITDVSSMDALFKKVLRYALAKEFCMALSGDVKTRQLMEQLYMQAKREAAAINHQERPMRIVERDPVALARLMDTEIWDGQIPVPPSLWPTGE